jgi:DNA-binding IclR family transcriptional regulator
MTDTLPKATYAVLRAVPPEWWPEAEAVAAISEALARPPATVKRTLTQLVTRGLVERRVRQLIAPVPEIRRVSVS